MTCPVASTMDKSSAVEKSERVVRTNCFEVQFPKMHVSRIGVRRIRLYVVYVYGFYIYVYVLYIYILVDMFVYCI